MNVKVSTMMAHCSMGTAWLCRSSPAQTRTVLGARIKRWRKMGTMQTMVEEGGGRGLCSWRCTVVSPGRAAEAD